MRCSIFEYKGTRFRKICNILKKYHQALRSITAAIDFKMRAGQHSRGTNKGNDLRYDIEADDFFGKLITFGVLKKLDQQFGLDKGIVEGVLYQQKVNVNDNRIIGFHEGPDVTHNLFWKFPAMGLSYTKNPENNGTYWKIVNAPENRNVPYCFEEYRQWELPDTKTFRKNSKGMEIPCRQQCFRTETFRDNARRLLRDFMLENKKLITPLVRLRSNHTTAHSMRYWVVFKTFLKAFREGCSMDERKVLCASMRWKPGSNMQILYSMKCTGQLQELLAEFICKNLVRCPVRLI